MSLYYRKNEKVSTRLIGGETMLIPVAGKLADLRRIYVLNEVGVYIWEQLDGRCGLDKIERAIQQHFEVDGTQAQADCTLYIKDLLAAGLVEEAS